jgi:hypothetical protein
MAALAMGLYMRQKGLDAIDEAHEIYSDHPLPIAERDQFHLPTGGDARIVAKNVQLPKAAKVSLAAR